MCFPSVDGVGGLEEVVAFEEVGKDPGAGFGVFGYFYPAVFIADAFCVAAVFFWLGSENGEIDILSGLKPGEQVVTRGVNLITEGMVVTLSPAA